MFIIHVLIHTGVLFYQAFTLNRKLHNYRTSNKENKKLDVLISNIQNLEVLGKCFGSPNFWRPNRVQDYKQAPILNL